MCQVRAWCSFVSHKSVWELGSCRKYAAAACKGKWGQACVWLCASGPQAHAPDGLQAPVGRSLLAPVACTGPAAHSRLHGPQVCLLECSSAQWPCQPNQAEPCLRLPPHTTRLRCLAAYDPAQWSTGPVWFADRLWPSIPDLAAAWNAATGNNSSSSPRLSPGEAEQLRSFKKVIPSE
jgi:hypothetical protein